MSQMPDTNPRIPTLENLEWFYQERLVPKYHDEKVKVDVGKGKHSWIPKLTFNKVTLKPEAKFSRSGRTWRPRKMFLEQNSGFKPLAAKYKAANVEKLKEKATAMPSLKFSMKEVKLIKPTY